MAAKMVLAVAMPAWAKARTATEGRAVAGRAVAGEEAGSVGTVAASEEAVGTAARRQAVVAA